jgi:tetratricopeptide (TPR) repeat protein
VKRAVLALLLGTVAHAQERPADAEIALGRAAFDAGEYQEALARFARAAEIDPDDWRGYACHALTLVRQAAAEPDHRRREGVLREAERVAGILVKRRLIEFHDPLYRFVQGIVLQVGGEDAKAREALSDALRAPRERYARYEEIGFRRMVERAFAISSLRIGWRHVAAGRFEDADTELKIAARYLPAGDPEQSRLERLLAAAAEALGRRDEAVAHVRRAIDLAKDAREVDELRGTIAMIHLASEDFEKARAALAEARADSRHPEIVAARCTLLAKEALRERTKLDDALAAVRDAFRACPPEDAYRIAMAFVDLVLAKVGPREAATPDGRALLEEAAGISKRQIELRPECPPPYHALSRIHALLGDAEEARRLEGLHESRKRDWAHQEKYDHRGRPRCGG